MNQIPASLPLLRSRSVERLVQGRRTSNGEGVKLTRVLTEGLQERLDPFLMLDAFDSECPEHCVRGFAQGPHRGFETVTYMLAGRMRHQDSAGNTGVLEPGGVQWTTTGRGLVHAETPEPEDGSMEGFQLWVNLAANDKMQAPACRELLAADIPAVLLDSGVAVRIIAGSARGIRGAVQRPRTEPIYLDVEMPPGSRFEAEVPSGHNAFVYAFRGEVSVGEPATSVPVLSMAILSNEAEATGVVLTASCNASMPSRALLIAGRPLREPIVRYGPFVMNSPEQIHQALADFRAGAIER